MSKDRNEQARAEAQRKIEQAADLQAELDQANAEHAEREARGEMPH